MELEDRWKYEKVDINLIDEAELNANEMSGEDYAQLCDNIGKAGLSSVPCCYKKSDGRFVMISGHHRLRACKKVGFKRIGILYVTEEELMQDEAIATQLSHNSLHGEDNQSILKILFGRIKDVDFKKFAHINIDEIGNIDVGSIASPLEKETFTVTLVLYNKSMQFFEELVGELREAIKKSDVVLMAENEPNEELYLKLSKEINQKLEIKSSNIIFSKILELALMQIGDSMKAFESAGKK